MSKRVYEACDPRVHLPGTTWEGRGLRIELLRVGLGILWVRRLDLLPPFDIHWWAAESMHGMTRMSK